MVIPICCDAATDRLYRPLPDNHDIRRTDICDITLTRPYMQEPDNAIYQTLLESTKAIPWQIDWETKQFSYIGPQIQKLLGWDRTSWKTVEDWVARIHPEDREEVFNFCVRQSLAGVDHEADYRALTADGSYVWIRDVVHVVRNGDEVQSLIGFMFDISERKRTEEELLRLQSELQELSFKDGLTGVANRRMFDTLMDVEWSQALRNRQPLSLLMIDIDYFKQYNDHYGHIQGDDCLRQVSQLLSGAATRSRDFIARFGGEEFALVLPETNLEAALKVAQRCHDLVAKAQIPHLASDIGSVLTVSQGVGSITPTADDDLLSFITAVDDKLYEAKQRGRNRIAAA